MIDPIQYLDDGTKHLFDAVAGTAFILQLVGVALPHLLTAATLVWVILRIWEMQTVRGWVAAVKGWRKPKG